MRFSLLTVLSLLLAGASNARADIIWEHSYAAAKTISRASGKPLFIDFYTDWCGVCKKVDREVFPDPKVQQLSKNFVMLRLNAEREGAPQAREFGVRAYPTLLWISPQGQPIHKLAGGPDAAGFVQLMQQVLQSVPTSGASSNRATRSRPDAQTVAMRQQKLMRRATGNGNQRGVVLLDENGAVALDGPRKKAKLRATSAKKPRKTAGY